jgi:hypothetical protein
LARFTIRQEFGFGDSPLVTFGHLGSQPMRLRIVACDAHTAALDDSGLDALARRHGDHFVDGAVECVLPLHHRGPTVLGGQQRAVSRR